MTTFAKFCIIADQSFNSTLIQMITIHIFAVGKRMRDVFYNTNHRAEFKMTIGRCRPF